jgi:hypothetical protein
MMYRWSTSSRSSASVAALTALCAAASLSPRAELGAQIAPGSTLVFTGTANATDIGTPGVLLDFDKRVNVDPTANTGTFASLDRRNGANGQIDAIRVGNGPQSLANFLRVGAYTFDLRSVPSGTYGQDDCYVLPTPEKQQCTPFQSVAGDPTTNIGLSPFFVENFFTGDTAAPFNSIAAFNVLGTVNGPGRTSSNFFGTIAATFVGKSYQEALGELEFKGLRGVTFTGTFVAGAPPAMTTGPWAGPAAGSAFGSAGLQSGPVALAAETVVPEPSTIALLATGLGVLGAAARRRRSA